MVWPVNQKSKWPVTNSFSLSVQRSRIQVWLYEQVNMRIEGCIIVSKRSKSQISFFPHSSFSSLQIILWTVLGKHVNRELYIWFFVCESRDLMSTWIWFWMTQRRFTWRPRTGSPWVSVNLAIPASHAFLRNNFCLM